MTMRDEHHDPDPHHVTHENHDPTPAESSSSPELTRHHAPARPRLWSEMLPRQRTRHLLAVDTTYIVRRAWHACVNDKRDEPEQAAPTALGTLARLLRARQPTHALFAGEGLGSIRKQLFEGYKAGRPPKPDGLLACEAAVEMALVSAGTPLVKAAGLEGDDVLHAAALLVQPLHIPVVIVSHDQDVEQIVNDGAQVIVWDGVQRVLDEAAVLERWGVVGARLTDLFALAGQDGDGIPGVTGWRAKTALKVLQAAPRHPVLKLLAPGGHWWVPTRWREKFVASRENVLLSYELVRLRGEQVVGRLDLENLEVDPLAVAAALRDSADQLGARGQDDGGTW